MVQDIVGDNNTSVVVQSAVEVYFRSGDHRESSERKIIICKITRIFLPVVVEWDVELTELVRNRIALEISVVNELSSIVARLQRFSESKK